MQIDAEEIVELVFPSYQLAEMRMDKEHWNELMGKMDNWACRECVGDYEHKEQALEWLALSEDERADACEAYLGAVCDRYRVAFED